MKKKNMTRWAMIIPATIVLAFVLLYPIGNTIWLSFRREHLLRPTMNAFVGFQNYSYVLQSRDFLQSLKVTAYFTGVSVFIEFVIGLFTAILLNQDFKMKAFLRVLVVLPWAIPTVANGVMWQWIFDTNYGALNGLLSQLGLISEYVNWLGTPFGALNSVIIADIWKNCWFFTIVLLGALQAIPKNYYEAAYVDGAGFWKRLFKVTLPLLKPAIAISLVLRISEAFKAFDIIYIMTKGGPANGTQVLSYYVYHTAFESLRMGRGAAISTVVTVLILIIAIIFTNVLMREEVDLSA